MIKIKEKSLDRVYQGDIFKNIEQIEYYKECDGTIEISKVIFPYVVVLTQDCDLAQYSPLISKKRNYDEEGNIIKQKNDKFLLSLLVAPLYNVEHFFSGSHLSELEFDMEIITKNKTPGKNIMKNINPRYHYIEFPDTVPLTPAVIDFKHYFSVNVETMISLKENNCICQIAELYREQLSHRFSHFLSRIGLPDIPQECDVSREK